MRPFLGYWNFASAPSPQGCSAALAAAALILVVGGARHASAQTTLSPSVLTTDTAILSQFNLVDFGDYTAGNETEGRVVVGGNLIGSGYNIGFNNGFNGSSTSAINGQQYGDVTVFGNVTGGFSPQGNVAIQGTASGAFNTRASGYSFNVGGYAGGTSIGGAGAQVNTSQSSFAGQVQQGSTVATNVASATVFPYSTNGSSFSATFQTPLSTLSAALANLPSTAGVTAQALQSGNNVVLTAGKDYTSGGLTYGVVTTTYGNLANEQNFGGINNNGNAATIVVVTGSDPNISLPNLNSGAYGNVIWDFVDATVLKFSGSWFGTILAPLATITQQGGNLDGPVVVNGLMQSKELHFDNQGAFAGNLSGLGTISTGQDQTAVPEPSSVLLIGTGAAGLGMLRRRRTSRRKVGDSAVL